MVQERLLLLERLLCGATSIREAVCDVGELSASCCGAQWQLTGLLYSNVHCGDAPTASCEVFDTSIVNHTPHSV